MTSTVDAAHPAPTADPALTAAPSPPRLARVLGAIGRGLITAGIVVLLFAAYELWGTNIAEARAQSGLRDDFDSRVLEARSLFSAAETPVEVEAGTPDSDPTPLPVPSTTLPGGYDPEVLRHFFPEGGEAVARIEIPSIGVDKIVVSGVQVADLRKGPGHYPGTALVGEEGNTAIAGHRTTYGAPFGDIDELAPGDLIHVTGVLGRFTYRVMTPEQAYGARLDEATDLGAGHTIVRPSATWVLDDFGDDRLTLTACHPKYSARRRIIVAAELVDEPVRLPDWADVAARAAAAGDDPADSVADLGAAEGESDDGAGRVDPEDAPPREGSPTDLAELDGPSLDEGLDGERDAIPGAVAWMLAAITLWVGGGFVARRQATTVWTRLGLRLVALVPAMVCVWFSFELIDRALPAA